VQDDWRQLFITLLGAGSVSRRVRLDEKSALQKPADLDGREPEVFGKLGDLYSGGLTVARQEHDSSPAMDGWSLARTAASRALKPLTSLATAPDIYRPRHRTRQEPRLNTTV